MDSKINTDIQPGLRNGRFNRVTVQSAGIVDSKPSEILELSRGGQSGINHCPVPNVACHIPCIASNSDCRQIKSLVGYSRVNVHPAIVVEGIYEFTHVVRLRVFA